MALLDDVSERKNKSICFGCEVVENPRAGTFGRSAALLLYELNKYAENTTEGLPRRSCFTMAVDMRVETSCIGFGSLTSS